MTLRPGSYNAARPVWRGVIRQDGYPWYVCNHNDHPEQRHATECARKAHELIKSSPVDQPLPDGWDVYRHGARL